MTGDPTKDGGNASGGNGVVRNASGQIVKGSGPLNPKGRPKGRSTSARLLEACEREARKLGMSFEEFVAQQAISGRDKQLIRMIVDKFIPNAPQKTELEVSVRPAEDEIAKIRQSRWDAYQAN